MRKLVNTFLAVIFVATAVMAQDKPAPKAQTGGSDPVIIKSGDLQIRKSEFEAALKTIPAEYQAYAAGPGKKAFAEDYIRMKLLAREAEKHGLDKTAETIQQLKMLRENALANAELDRIEKNIQVSDADVQKVYDQRKPSFEQAKARHILIAFKGSQAAQAGKDLTEEQAKAKAEDIRKKIAAGADFAELAKAESDDKGSGARGGELGWFTKGQMVPEFEKAAFETKPGELSAGVIRTQFGYHVIKVDEHRTQALSDVKPQLQRELRQTRLQEKLDALKTTANPTFDETYFTPAPSAEPVGTAEKPATSGTTKP